MKYTLEVEMVDDVTRVNLIVLNTDGFPLTRKFTCCENEMIHFSVHEGQLVFSGHTVKPPQSFFGSGLGVITP